MYITKYGCVFLKLGESIYVAMDLIPILLGSLPLAHNAQHSLVIITYICTQSGAYELPKAARSVQLRRMAFASMHI